MSLFRALVLTVIATAPMTIGACSSSDVDVVPPDEDAGSDTSTVGDTATDGRAEVTEDGAAIDGASSDVGTEAAADSAPEVPLDTARPLNCTDPTTFPDFGKGCTIDAHCRFGLHQLDCCGSLGAIGINEAFADDFKATEDAYRKTCAICDCTAKATRTESGVTTTDPTKIAVRCDAGLCKTYVK